MKGLKISFIFLVIFLIVFLLINIIYKKVVLSKEYIDAYAVNKYFNRGNSISKDDIYIVKIPKNKYVETMNISDEYLNDSIIREEIKENQVITKELFTKKSEYKFEKDKEIISINIDKNDISTNSKLDKDSIVNIYFIPDNIQDIDKQVKCIEKNVKVIDVNDDSANSVSNSKEASKIIVSLSNEKVMLVNNYKQKGKFSITLIN